MEDHWFYRNTLSGSDRRWYNIGYNDGFDGKANSGQNTQYDKGYAHGKKDKANAK